MSDRRTERLSHAPAWSKADTCRRTQLCVSKSRTLISHRLRALRRLTSVVAKSVRTHWSGIMVVDTCPLHPPRCGLKDDDLYRGGWHVIDSRRAARAVSHSLAADRTKGRNAGVRSEDMLSSFRHRSHGVWSASRPPGESSVDETRCIAHHRHRNLATCPLSCSPCLAMGVPAFGQ